MSTRVVGTLDNVLISGFIVETWQVRRGRARPCPSLTASGLSGVLSIRTDDLRFNWHCHRQQ